MSTPILTFFNHKGDVGKTALVYHLAWMYADLGLRVVAADLDPQAKLTAACLDDDQMEYVFAQTKEAWTIFDFVAPLRQGIRDIAPPRLYPIDEDEDQLALLIGDLALSHVENDLSEAWFKCLERDEQALRVTTAFWSILQQAALSHRADIVLVDLGSNLGAINRAMLIATDYVVIPLASDRFSLQSLGHLGPTLQRWRTEWKARGERKTDFPLPIGTMQPIGYIVLQHAVRLDRPVQALDRWITRIPQMYRREVLNESEDEDIHVGNDPYALACLKNYSTLMPMSQESRKPMFRLKSADGAIGAYMVAVQRVYHDMKKLAQNIAEKMGLKIPS